MRLRTRLALSVVAAALPLAAGTVWVRHDLEQRRVAGILREFAVATMEAGGRARCEAAPETFPPPPAAPARDPAAPPLPPPPPEVGPMPGTTGSPDRPAVPEVTTKYWAYAADFVSANPHAPPILTVLEDELRSGADVAVQRLEPPAESGHMALVRMPWTDGPAAYLLVRRSGPETGAGALELWWSGVLVSGGVLIAVLLASGPIVRRIRRLEASVRRSAADHYETSVLLEGSDEVADLARAFDEAAGEVRGHLAQVERREETLRTFVANTTHDVMTPLTVLAGHLDALRARIRSDDTEATESLRDALTEVDYTTSLVANLGTAAKLEAGPKALSLHAVDLNSLVERVAARHRPVARTRAIELNHAIPADPVFLEGDVTLLEQAVGNVVQNAIRYGERGGHVAFVLRASGRERFEIQITDDGPGLSDEDFERMTQRGYRGAAARTRGASGHGLGLDITRGVCGRMGLELAFERPAKGGLSVKIGGPRMP